jgi:hypothetical protein
MAKSIDGALLTSADKCGRIGRCSPGWVGYQCDPLPKHGFLRELRRLGSPAPDGESGLLRLRGVDPKQTNPEATSDIVADVDGVAVDDLQRACSRRDRIRSHRRWRADQTRRTVCRPIPPKRYRGAVRVVVADYPSGRTIGDLSRRPRAPGRPGADALPDGSSRFGPHRGRIQVAHRYACNPSQGVRLQLALPSS